MADDPALYLRPSEVEIRFDGTDDCQLATIDGDGWQSIDLEFDPIGDLTVGVVAVGETSENQYPLVVVAEIRVAG